MEASQIHIALNEDTASEQTIEDLIRVGRVLGDRDGTGPLDDAQIAGYMLRSHEVGQQAGFTQGLQRGRTEGIASAAKELLRLRKVALSPDFPRRLSLAYTEPEALLDAADSLPRRPTSGSAWHPDPTCPCP